MPPLFTRAVRDGYRQDLEDSLPTIEDRLNYVTNGRVAPSVDDLRISAARKVTAAVIFFDIRGFTARTSSADIAALKATLYMLNCVIPAMMRVLFRHGAYVEKNTGDGLMAILGVESNVEAVARDALSACSEMMYVLHNLVNPVLLRNGLAHVDARIGVDIGDILLARIGLPRGTAAHERSTLTAVGPAANIACKLQGMAGTNEIWCGDKIKINAPEWRHRSFELTTPLDWAWIYEGSQHRYHCWRFTGRTSDPDNLLLGALLGDL